MLSKQNKPASKMTLHEAATIVGSLGGRPGKYWLSGVVSITPIQDNLLFLGDQQLTLGTTPLSLGPADMAIDISNPGTNAAALSAALGPLLGLLYDPTTGRVGVGVTSTSQLGGQLTVKPSASQSTTLKLLNDDASTNIKFTKSVNSGSESIVQQDLNGNFIVTPGNRMGIKGLHTVTFDEHNLSQDETYRWPDPAAAIGDLALDEKQLTVSQLTPPTNTNDTGRAFVTDSTQTLSAGLGTAPVGGGTNYVPVYWNATAAAWRIG